MGKATIVSGGTDGSYTIKMDYGKDLRDLRVTKLTTQLAEIAPKITDAQAKRDAQQTVEDGMRSAVQEAEDAYVAATQAVAVAFQALASATSTLQSVASSPSATDAERTAAQAAMKAAEAHYKTTQSALNPAIAKHAAAIGRMTLEKARTTQTQMVLDLLEDKKKLVETERADLNALQLEKTMQAWCADFTEGGAGVVGTIEVPGENKHVLIMPGAAAYANANGHLAARELMTPEQVFFNAAILPGWQKFKPTFRRGKITAIEVAGPDTVSVEFTDDRSSAQNLGINRDQRLNAIPVEYMSCNAAVFEVGDTCLVRFDGQNWSAPKVIGFAGNPRPCNWPCVHASPNFYRYIFENKLSAIKPSTMSDLMSTAIDVQVRVNRGAWVKLIFVQNITASGGRNFNQWRAPGGSGTPRAELYVGYKFYLSADNDLSAPAVNGVSLLPPLPVGVPAGTSIPTVHEYKITIGDKIRFHAAIFSDPGINTAATQGRVRTKGGIKKVGDSLPIVPMDYELGGPPAPP